MLKLPVRENSTFCMLGWVRATITLRRDGGADRELARAEWTAQLPRLRSVMCAHAMGLTGAGGLLALSRV